MRGGTCPSTPEQERSGRLLASVRTSRWAHFGFALVGSSWSCGFPPWWCPGGVCETQECWGQCRGGLILKMPEDKGSRLARSVVASGSPPRLPFLLWAVSTQPGASLPFASVSP